MLWSVRGGPPSVRSGLPPEIGLPSRDRAFSGARGSPGRGLLPSPAMHQVRYTPGSRVRVVKQLPKGSGVLVSETVGEVLRYGQEKTGSWFAHSADKKLWLDRLELRKDDGEIVVLNLDQFTKIELVQGAVAA